MACISNGTDGADDDELAREHSPFPKPSQHRYDGNLVWDDALSLLLPPPTEPTTMKDRFDGNMLWNEPLSLLLPTPSLDPCYMLEPSTDDSELESWMPMLCGTGSEFRDSNDPEDHLYTDIDTTEALDLGLDSGDEIFQHDDESDPKSHSLCGSTKIHIHQHQTQKYPLSPESQLGATTLHSSTSILDTPDEVGGAIPSPFRFHTPPSLDDAFVDIDADVNMDVDDAVVNGPDRHLVQDSPGHDVHESPSSDTHISQEIESKTGSLPSSSHASLIISAQDPQEHEQDDDPLDFPFEDSTLDQDPSQDAMHSTDLQMHADEECLPPLVPDISCSSSFSTECDSLYMSGSDSDCDKKYEYECRSDFGSEDNLDIVDDSMLDGVPSMPFLPGCDDGSYSMPSIPYSWKPEDEDEDEDYLLEYEEEMVFDIELQDFALVTEGEDEHGKWGEDAFILVE